MRRRDFVQHLLWCGAALATGAMVDAERIIAAASGQVDARLLDDLQTVAAGDAARMHTTAPGELLPDVGRHLAYAHARLRMSQSAADQARLHLVAGALGAVAGRLSSMLGNPGDAHADWMAADGHAREAGDGPLRAYVLGQRSRLYSEVSGGPRRADPSTALALLDEAMAVAGAGSSPWLRTWLAARRAEEHAARGDVRATSEDLQRAEQVLSTAIPADGFFTYWQEAPLALLSGFRGNCTQLLGRAREATAVIEESLHAVSPSLPAVRSGVMTNLAMAYARQQEVEHACALLAESLELSSDAGLVAHAQRVATVSRELAPWHHVPAVRDLDERLRGVTWALI